MKLTAQSYDKEVIEEVIKALYTFFKGAIELSIVIEIRPVSTAKKVGVILLGIQ